MVCIYAVVSPDIGDLGGLVFSDDLEPVPFVFRDFREVIRCGRIWAPCRPESFYFNFSIALSTVLLGCFLSVSYSVLGNAGSYIEVYLSFVFDSAILFIALYPIIRDG